MGMFQSPQNAESDRPVWVTLALAGWSTIFSWFEQH
jgi:hypothetical protein